MARRVLVILNPASRGRTGAKRFARVEEALRAALGAIEIERTRGPRDAERLAREAVRSGVERLVVAGGDGTLSEVVSGLLSAELARYVEIGLLPLGSGGDFAHCLGIPRDLARAIVCLAEGTARTIDAGRATFATPDGGKQVSWFANVASFGISGLVSEFVNRGHKPFGGTVAFAMAALRAIARYDPQPVTIRVDGEPVLEGPVTLVAAANGRRFGGGMQIAPDARLDDGQLDLVAISRLSRRRLLRELPGLYAGTHLESSAVTHCRGRVIEIEGASQVPLELDGELLGCLPARFEVLPRALTLTGPRP